MIFEVKGKYIERPNPVGDGKTEPSRQIMRSLMMKFLLHLGIVHVYLHSRDGMAFLTGADVLGYLHGGESPWMDSREGASFWSLGFSNP